MKIIARRRGVSLSALLPLMVAASLAVATQPALALEHRALLATTATTAATTAAATPATSSPAAPAAALAKTSAAAPMLDPAASSKMDPAVAAAITGTGTPDPSLVPKQTGVPLSLDGRPRGEKRTVDEVNEQAPTFRMPTASGMVEARPNLAVDMGGAASAPPAAAAAAAAAAVPGTSSSPKAPPQLATAADVAAAKKETSDAATAAAALSSRLPGDPSVPVAPSYLPPTNPAYAEGAPPPALASLLAAARAAEAPGKAAEQARIAASKMVVPKFANDEQDEYSTAARAAAVGGKDSAAALQKAVDATAATTPASSSVPAPSSSSSSSVPAAASSSSSSSASSSTTAAALDNGGFAPKVNRASNAADGGTLPAELATPKGGAASDGLVSAKGLDNPLGQVVNGNVGGTTLNLLVGARTATPFFGTGFNLCVDRYFGSFPKVGIVIPNPIAWLLPEIIDIGSGISATLDLPAAGVTAPAGARVTSTSDGFVIWLPSIQPTQLGEFGFRYGLQVAQLFGVDFGFGLLKSTCTIDFVRV